MIEPTDEMVQAAQQATCGAEADDCMRDALAVVLEIVERDHVVLCSSPRPLDDSGYGCLRCTRRVGHVGKHEWREGDIAVSWP